MNEIIIRIKTIFGFYKYKAKAEYVAKLFPQLQICYTINPYLWVGYSASLIIGIMLNLRLMYFIAGIFGGILFSISVMTNLIGLSGEK